MEKIKLITDIAQNVAIILTAIFTAFWAYRTFAYKDRIADLKNIIKLLERLHWEVFFYQPLFSKSQNGKSISIDNLLTYCSELQSLAKTNFYLSKKDRTQVEKHIEILTKNMLCNGFDAFNNEGALQQIRKQFDNEYQIIMKILQKRL